MRGPCHARGCAQRTRSCVPRAACVAVVMVVAPLSLAILASVVLAGDAGAGVSGLSGVAGRDGAIDGCSAIRSSPAAPDNQGTCSAEGLTETLACDVRSDGDTGTVREAGRYTRSAGRQADPHGGASGAAGNPGANGGSGSVSGVAVAVAVAAASGVRSSAGDACPTDKAGGKPADVAVATTSAAAAVDTEQGSIAQGQRGSLAQDDGTGADEYPAHLAELTAWYVCCTTRHAPFCLCGVV